MRCCAVQKSGMIFYYSKLLLPYSRVHIRINLDGLMGSKSSCRSIKDFCFVILGMLLFTVLCACRKEQFLPFYKYLRELIILSFLVYLTYSQLLTMIFETHCKA
jgi:hypothetical protein